MTKKKIIIDTDIGDDIDDAYALSLACVMPEVEILGVVTVFKNVATRCKMAKMMLSLGGKAEVPVYQGLSHALAQTILYGKPIDFEAQLWSYTENCENYAEEFKNGIEFYINTLEQAQEPITIVTIGAMTNLAYVLRERPDLVAKIDKVLIMGGAYETNYAEYNFSCDPEAAELIMRADVDKVAVGLDVTWKSFLNEDDLEKLKNVGHPLTEQLLSFLSPTQKVVYLHDPLTLYYLVEPELFEFRRDLIHVETTGKFTRGMVAKMDNCNWNLDSKDSRFVYAVKCDARKFIDVFVERLCALANQ